MPDSCFCVNNDIKIVYIMIKVKRVYDEIEKNDGCRVLIDRLWPRGISKEKAEIDLWIREIAPSDSLRKWFAHDPEKWKEFRKRYKTELKNNSDNLHLLRELVRKEKVVTLLYAAKDKEHNNAVALKENL